MDDRLKQRLTRLWEQNDQLKEAEALYLELEANRKPLYSQLFLHAEGKNVAEKEARAYDSKDWRDFMAGLIAAESAFNYEKRKFGILENAFFAEHSSFKLDERSIRKAGA